MLLCGLTDKDLRRICRCQYGHPGSAIGYWPKRCLGHVYIVLEPVGSARLKFYDDRYYDFICFDVPKVVHSPGYDHRHDKESQNGRDMKINILEGYIRTSERFRVIRVLFGVPGNYGNSPGQVMGLIGPYGKKGGMPRGGGARPPHGSELD